MRALGVIQADPAGRFPETELPSSQLTPCKTVIINERLRHCVRLDSANFLPGPEKYSAGALSTY
jgi:hypothetical protein